MRRGGRSTTIRARRTVVGGGSGAAATVPGAGEKALVRKAASGVRGAGRYVRKEVDEETKEKKASERKFTDKLLQGWFHYRMPSLFQCQWYCRVVDVLRSQTEMDEFLIRTNA